MTLTDWLVESEETFPAPPESKALDLLAAGKLSAAVAAIAATAYTQAASPDDPV